MREGSPGAEGRPRFRDRAAYSALMLATALVVAGIDHWRERRARQAPAVLAARPRDEPARDWRSFAASLYKRISEHRVLAVAAGVTFYVLLAIFPAIAALVSLYGLFSDPAVIAQHIDALTGLLPAGAIEVIHAEVARVAAGGATKLGVTFVISLGVSLWSANAGMKALFDALNVVYAVPEQRGLVALNLVSLLFTLAGVAALLCALGAVVVVPIVLNHVGLGSQGAVLVAYARWPLLLVSVAMALALIYRVGPDRTGATWRFVTVGSAVAALIWVLASLLFSWYAANFGSFNKTYGSLGAAIGFMTWIWLSTIVMLVGAEIDALRERCDESATRWPPVS